MRAFIALTLVVVTTVAGWAQSAKITNVFTDQDLRQVLAEIGTATGTSILADASVKGMEVSIEFRDDSIDSALTKLSYVAGLLWKRKGDLILVSTPAPDAPLFHEFARTKTYMPRTQTAESLFALLSRTFSVYAQLDKAANLISVTAPEPLLQTVLDALGEADKPRRQFVVEAIVTEIRDGAGDESGFTWNWRHFAQEDQGLSYAKASPADIVRLKALVSENKATLRASPRIMATEGREAMLTIGTETYFSLVTGNANASTIQLQRVNAGISMRFTGFVGADGMISLHVQPEVSDVAAPVGGSPSTTVRRANTYVRVQSGQTLALGGLILDAGTQESRKVPVLGDLPGVGGLFRSRRQSTRRTEVVILITPRLIPDESGTPSG